MQEGMEAEALWIELSERGATLASRRISFQEGGRASCECWNHASVDVIH